VIVQAPFVHVAAAIVGPAVTEEDGVPIPNTTSYFPTVGDDTLRVQAVPLGSILMASCAACGTSADGAPTPGIEAYPSFTPVVSVEETHTAPNWSPMQIGESASLL